MKNPGQNQPFLIPSLIVLVASLIHPLPAEADTTAGFAVSQTLESDGAYEAEAAVHTMLLKGSVALSIPDASEPELPELTTFSLRIEPLPRFAFHAGSITVSGLPSRAKKPFFAVSSPFYSPLEAENGTIFGTGTSTKTGKAALEYRSSILTAAAYTAAFDDPDEISWLLVSANFNSFSEKNDYLVISSFLGTRTIPAENETGWFIDEPSFSGSSLYLPGLECIFRKGEFGGSFTGFIDAASSRPPAALERSEIWFDTGSFLVACGHCLADRDYRGFDGSGDAILSRLFLAPLLSVDSHLFGESDITVGAILYHDTLRGERYWHENLSVLSGGSGVELETERTTVMVKGIKTGDDLTFSGSLRIKNLFIRTFRLNIGGKAEYPLPDCKLYAPDALTAEGKVSFEPFTRRNAALRMGTEYKGTYKAAKDEYINQLSIGLEASFFTGKTGWRCSLELVCIDDGSAPAGAITLKTYLN